MIDLRLGDCLDVLPDIADNSHDCLMTDPPAGIGFMAKEWDSNKGGRRKWIDWLSGILKECVRVVKPGAYGLVWALPRTAHRTMTAIEDSGLEVRDVVAHHFGNGFPKSMNLGDGKGTALKPATEFWVLCRKPISEKNVAANVLRWGTGGLNIDCCRIETQENLGRTNHVTSKFIDSANGSRETHTREVHIDNSTGKGRWPANLVLSHSEDCTDKTCSEGCPVAELGEPARFFYCPKPSRKEREAGCSALAPQQIYRCDGAGQSLEIFGTTDGGRSPCSNNHPTVKPVKLLRYFAKMICPTSGRCLDCFMGSGSTGVACADEGFSFTGIELDEGYYKIAKARIEAAEKKQASG